MIYLVDIDGTLADLTHRLHFIEQKPADWDTFFGACLGDGPICEVIQTIQLLQQSGAEIMFVTGRSDAVRKQTEDWLSDYGFIPNVRMRKEGDHRQDDVVKGELLDGILKEIAGREGPQQNIVGVFEDRQQVVDMYRARGLRVFQVAPGNF